MFDDRKYSPIKANTSCKFPWAKPAGIQMIPVNIKEKEHKGFRPQWSITNMTKRYAGTSVKAESTVETNEFDPNLLEAIDIP